MDDAKRLPGKFYFSASGAARRRLIQGAKAERARILAFIREHGIPKNLSAGITEAGKFVGCGCCGSDEIANQIAREIEEGEHLKEDA